MSIRAGIDASNLRGGGGITHLREMLAAADPRAAGISEIVVWGAQPTLDELPSRPWLHLVHQKSLEKGLLARRFWQSVTLARLAQESVDVLFAPGGTYQGSFRPFVTMCRNMLPFDPPERARYNGTRIGLRLRILSYTQAQSFRKAAAVIFLTRTAERLVLAQTGTFRGRTRVIPHGVASEFLQPPRPQREISAFTMQKPFHFVYVSIVDLYKHQARVAEAAGVLRAKGMPVSVDFIGPAYPPSLTQLRAAMKAADPDSVFLRCRGALPYSELPGEYRKADGAIFASSCENMPNILLESMASGLPVACSDRGVMPEILGDGGAYFDPESSMSIASALETLMASDELRTRYAASAYARASQYSWSRCARETLELIADVAGRSSSAPHPTE